jgi:FkbM family methyltransferase
MKVRKSEPFSQPVGKVFFRSWWVVLLGCCVSLVVIGGLGYLKSSRADAVLTADLVEQRPLNNNDPIKSMKSDSLVTIVDSTSSFQQFITLSNVLLQRVDESLRWILSGKSDSYPYIRWDLISNADIHILFKVKLFLSYYLHSGDRQKILYSLFSNGYRCNSLHAAQQELISKFISMDICSEIEWYKMAHLSYPDARVIFDIGGNKGYLGSLFLTLWGGGGINCSPVDILNTATKLGTWKNSRNPGGYCRDGYNAGVSLFCPVARDAKTGRCTAINDDIRVSSFDGSSYLANTLTDIVHNHIFPHPGDRKEALLETMKRRQFWTYTHYAISNKEGKAKFSKQSVEKNAGFEGGSINPLRDKEIETEDVNVTTVDAIMERIKREPDIVKIDTEGNDNKVLLGARNSLRSYVKLFTFEGGGGVTFSKTMSDEFETLGFSCYSTSRAGLFKWSSGCMKDRYFGSFRKKDKGNIFCVHRKRAPIMALAFDILSFPALIDFHFLHSNSSHETSKDKLLYQALFEDVTNLEAGELRLNFKTDPSLLLPLYINIYGFCRPWPSCLSNL